MTSLGRTLRTLRVAAGLSIEDGSVASSLAPRRIRELERGAGTLGYVESLALTKTYLLCATCFKRHVEAALARDGIDVEDGPALEDASA
jgi:transcriptional regulator with XRE-family HTH domain